MISSIPLPTPPVPTRCLSVRVRRPSEGFFYEVWLRISVLEASCTLFFG